VRIPARLNTDLHLTAPVALPGLPLPLYVEIAGDPDFASEELVAYEAGYRLRATDTLSFDVAIFDNHYDHLQTNEVGAVQVVTGPPAYLVLPGMQGNLMQGETYGGTFVASWQPMQYWRLQFQYSHLQMDLESKPGSRDANAVNLAGNSPKNQAAAQSYLELPHNLSLFTAVRYVDSLPSLRVASYLAVDWSLGWRANDHLRLSLTIRNANDAEHAEFADGDRIERSAYVKAAWNF
jgi:iron complex outermembrane receptor protein